MKQRIQMRFQQQLDCCLGHSIRHCRHSENAHTSCLLRNRHGTYRRRYVAAGAHPIPQLVQVVAQITLELLDRLVVNACGAAVRLHTFECLPDQLLRNFKSLGHGRTLLPLARLTCVITRITQPLRSTAITAASSLLRVAPPLDGASLLSASPLGLAPFAWHRRRRFPQFNARARITITLPLCRTPLGS